jgi:hypothetical protein
VGERHLRRKNYSVPSGTRPLETTFFIVSRKRDWYLVSILLLKAAAGGEK